MLLGPVNLMNFLLLLSHSMNIQGRECNLGDFIESTFNIGCFEAHRLVSFQLDMIRPH